MACAKEPATSAPGSSPKEIGVPVTLAGQPVDAAVPIDHGHGPAFDLVLAGFSDDPIGAYAIYLNPPPGPRDDPRDNPHFIGDLAVYGSMPPELVVHVAAAQIETLKSMAAWNDATATVRFVPTRTDARPPAVTIRRVVLRAP